MPEATSRIVSVLATFALCATAPSCSQPTAEFPHASIVLLSIDTLRADAVTGFGAPEGRTPRLARLGEEGIVFETAIAAAHITAPSHATMLTGFSPHVHRVAIAGLNKFFAIPPSIPTLAERLREAGYATAGFTDGVQILPAGGFHRGFDHFEHEPTGLGMKETRIRRFLVERGKKPFFLFAHTYRPHQPYRAPLDLLRELLEDYDGVFAEPARKAARASHWEVMKASPAQRRIAMPLSGGHAKTDEDRRFFHRLYEAGVTGADRETSDLLDLLAEVGAYDDVILVVTSDHGEAMWEHGIEGHTNIFDEVLRVPLIVRLPGARYAGRRVPETFASVDLVPTLLDLVGVPPKMEMEGRSAARALATGRWEEHAAYSAWWFSPDRAPGSFSTRTRSAKRFDVEPHKAPDWIRAMAPSAFYDLAADPGETTNLAGKGGAAEEELSRLAADATALWEKLRRRHGGDGAATDLGEAEIEALQGIGYK